MAKLALSLVAAYPEYAVESVGGPRFPVYPVINDAPSANTTMPVGGYSPLELGQILVDRYGHRYIYVLAQAGLTAGQIVTKAANPTEGAVVAAAQGANNIQVVRTSIAGITVKNQEVGNFIAFNNNTGTIGDLKLILGNTATGTAQDGTADAGNTHFTISKIGMMGRGGSFDANAPAAAYAAATSEVSLIRPYQVAVCGLNGMSMGVALGTVTAGNKTIVQTTGLAQCDGVAGTAFVDNVGVYNAAAGEVSVTAPATGLSTMAMVGISKSAYAGAASTLVPVWLVNLEGRW